MQCRHVALNLHYDYITINHRQMLQGKLLKIVLNIKLIENDTSPTNCDYLIY